MMMVIIIIIIIIIIITIRPQNPTYPIQKKTLYVAVRGCISPRNLQKIF
jgi:hypothetical protein